VGEAVKKGDQFYDFEAIDQNGLQHKLSDFNSKYLVLDFTEFGCFACVQSIPELSKIAKEYADKLTVISFFVDKNQQRWKDSLKQHPQNWTSLWDGNGQNGNTVLKYNVVGYPTFFIIDPSGKIIESFFGYGENQLSDYLSKTLNK
jgi:thiol-disulfide isomerase/thioredoxin